MTENIITGKYYRILVDQVNNIWSRVSFWKKASDVEFSDGTNLENNRPVAVLKRSTAYSVGDIAYISSSSVPSWVQLRCTTAGTTASTVPSTYSTISSVGVVITDGTAKFTVYDVRPSTTLSSSRFLIPSMSLVSAIDGQLTATNGEKFYFDYHNGRYGFNTDPSRDPTTFVSFQ